MLQSGTIGIDSMQRSTLCVSKNELVQIRCVDPLMQIEGISGIKFSILPEETHGSSMEYPPVDKDALAKHILEVLQGQAFTVFQTAVVSFHSVRVCVQVFEMETESTDLKVALCMGKHPRLGAKSALQKLDEAQLEVIWRRQVASSGDKLALLDGNSVVMCSFHSETRSPVIHDQDLHSSFRAEGIGGKLHPSLDNRNGHISHTIDGGRFSPANLSDASGDVPLSVARREDRLSPIHTAPSAPPVFVPEHPQSHHKVLRPSLPNCPTES